MERPHPDTVSVNLTSLCDQRCVYCEIGQRTEGTIHPSLDIDDLRWIIEEMRRHHIPRLVLGGGEPLLFPGLFQGLELALEAGLDCAMSTNGMRLPRLGARELALLRDGSVGINVSIDSFEPGIQAEIRGVERALERALAGLEVLRRENIPFGVMTTMSDRNHDQLWDVARNAAALGAVSVAFQPVIFESCFPEMAVVANKRALNIRLEHLARIEAQLDRIEEFERSSTFATNLGVLRSWLSDYVRHVATDTTNVPFFDHCLRRLHCDVLYRQIDIDYRGYILPCAMISSSRSIREVDDLLAQWNAACDPVRHRISNCQYPSACSSCVCDFDRNLVASALRYPVLNSSALARLLRHRVLLRLQS